MEDFELRRRVFSLLAFMVVVFIYLHVAISASVDVKKINEHRVRVLKENLERQGIVLVDHTVKK